MSKESADGSGDAYRRTSVLTIRMGSFLAAVVAHGDIAFTALWQAEIEPRAILPPVAMVPPMCDLYSIQLDAQIRVSLALSRVYLIPYCDEPSLL